ncbi:LysR substrate-binding domain-containing protein [Phenylobacterium sp. LjRoot219]|uniref:LysR substrate-binding domain-containing protein n=1 Tax=Phenylobacterium sp. LjRoot219 TaxID=3342283 RepID=UPI003ED03D60
MTDTRSPAERIPALQSLRAFEASVRLKSLTRAAEELGVTPSAITQHVRAVETWVGAPLFRRTGRYIIPTDAAEAAMPSLREGFDRIIEGAQLLKGSDRKGRVISISTTPAFASKWLLPRLDRFRALHPEIEVWVAADMKLIDFSTADVDLAVRYGPGGYDGLVAEQILSEAVVPMAAPDLAAELAVRAPADLLQARLLHDTGSDGDPSCPSWRSWFRTRGVDDLRSLDGPRYSDASLVIDEAIAGKGVALVKRTLADRDIGAGRLTPLLPDVTPVKFVYWLVWPRGRTLLPPVRAFIAWMKAEALGDVADGAGI